MPVVVRKLSQYCWTIGPKTSRAIVTFIPRALSPAVAQNRGTACRLLARADVCVHVSRLPGELSAKVR